MNQLYRWLIALMFVMAAGFANAQNVHGVLRVVKGDVQIKSAQTGQTSKAKLGEQVFPKDVIITGKDARAKIVMVDNNEINVSPESQIEIQHYEFDPNAGKKEVLLNVIYGKVRAKVEQKYDGKTSRFQVKTPAAVAGVRGTDFMTSFNRKSGDSQVITFRGRVEFGLPGPGGSIRNAVFVTPGTTATSARGSLPRPPSSIPKDQLAKMDNDTRADGAPTKSDTRAPSSNDSKKDDGKKSGDGSAGASSSPSSSSSSSTNSSTANSDASSNSGNGSSQRAPASDAGPTSSHPSVTSQELSGNCDCAPPPPPPPLPPLPPTPPRAPTCSTCQSLIQNGNSKVDITVHTK